MSTVTKAAFAVELGVTKGRVSQYLKSGMPVRDDGKVDRVEALNWLNTKRLNLTPGTKGLNHAAAVVKAAKSPPAKSRETSPKLRETSLDETTFELERTRKLKLENDERERKLFPDHMIEDVIHLLVGSLLVEFASYPAQMTDDLAMRRKLEDGLDAMRERHADRLDRAITDLRGGKDPLAAVAGDDPEGEEETSE